MNAITALEFTVLFTSLIIVSYYIRKILNCINTIEINIEMSNQYVDDIKNIILGIVNEHGDVIEKYLPSKKDEIKYKEFFLVLEECIDSFNKKELEDVKNNTCNDKATLLKFENEKKMVNEKFKKDTISDAKIKLFDIRHKNIPSLIDYFTTHGSFNPAITLLKSMLEKESKNYTLHKYINRLR